MLTAALSVDPAPAGVISLSGETNLSTNLDALKAAPKLNAPLLLLMARHDRYVDVEDYQALKQAAGSRNKQLVVYSGDWHGWDLLYKAPFRSNVNALVLGFLNEYSDDEE